MRLRKCEIESAVAIFNMKVYFLTFITWPQVMFQSPFETYLHFTSLSSLQLQVLSKHYSITTLSLHLIQAHPLEIPMSHPLVVY